MHLAEHKLTEARRQHHRLVNCGYEQFNRTHLMADVTLPCTHGQALPKYPATHGGPASYDPLAWCLTRRTAMYRQRDAEASF